MISYKIIGDIHGSIGELNSDYKNWFNSNGWVENNGNADINIYHYTHHKKVDKSKFNILIQPVDASLVSKAIVKLINNQFNLVTTLSSNGKKILIESGVKIPIEIVPNFYKKEIKEKPTFNYLKNNHNIDDDTHIFYHESSGINRKNVKKLLENYIKSFEKNDNVCLVLKVFSKSQAFKEILKTLNKYKKKPRVVFIFKTLSFNELHSIWHRINTYVSIAYSEGFGIPLIRMLALGKNIITLESKYSGYTDFLNENNSTLLPSKEIEIFKDKPSLLIFDENSKWEDLKDYNDLQKALKESLNKTYNYDNSYEKYEYNNIMSNFKKILIKHYEQFYLTSLKTQSSLIV